MLGLLSQISHVQPDQCPLTLFSPLPMPSAVRELKYAVLDTIVPLLSDQKFETAWSAELSHIGFGDLPDDIRQVIWQLVLGTMCDGDQRGTRAALRHATMRLSCISLVCKHWHQIVTQSSVWSVRFSLHALSLRKLGALCSVSVGNLCRICGPT